MATLNQYELFPHGQGIVINDDGQILLLRPLPSCSFTTQELPLLRALFDKWPRCCLYQDLLDLMEWTDGDMRPENVCVASDENIARLREILKTFQPRLALLELRIEVVLDRGFLLLPLHPPASDISSTHH